MGDQRLLPSERLRHAREFQRVFQQGKKLVAPLFVLYVLPTSALRSRLGITVSKRIGKAVVRNRTRRLMRELFRHYKALIQPPCDLVFVARRGATEASLEEYVQQFMGLLRRCQRSGEAKE
jgi:ribonuclease P protein component